LRRTQRSEDDDERDEQQENPAASEEPPPSLDRCERLVVLFGERSGGLAAVASEAAVPLVMAATSRSTLASAAVNRATRRPSRKTSIRSATSMTCGML
jgi:hypothetical protein